MSLTRKLEKLVRRLLIHFSADGANCESLGHRPVGAHQGFEALKARNTIAWAALPGGQRNSLNRIDCSLS
ncbi:MAG: hypothetical protein LC776_09585 [Acidobacteria bacterium]|nr:hypothetical protein [Acidobacteriota bacterium]